MKPSNKLINAANAVFQAEALVNTLKPVITRIRAKVLNDNNFMYDSELWHKSGKITNPSDDYMMSDDEHAIYCDILHNALIAHGFNVEPHYCPLLMAEEQLRQANRVLCDLSIEIHNMPNLTFDNLFRANKYNEHLDICKRYLVQFI